MNVSAEDYLKHLKDKVKRRKSVLVAERIAQQRDEALARLAAVEAERDAARGASEKDREWVGRALEKQAEYLGQSQMLVAERDAARGEAEKLRRLLDGYIALAISVRDKNTPEWMAGFAEDTNRTLEAIGVDDRVLLWRGNIYVKRLTNKGGQ